MLLTSVACVHDPITMPMPPSKLPPDPPPKLPLCLPERLLNVYDGSEELEEAASILFTD
jgi:hypothetical protein